MNITSSISKSSVFAEVSKITGYTGKNVQGNIENEKLFDLVAATTDEEDLLSTYWNDALETLFDSVKKYGASVSDTSSGRTFTFDLPSNFDSSGTSSIEKTMNLCVINWICAKWFNVSKKDEVEYYEREAGRLLNNLSRLLNARKKPIKK